jgi:hypothetical protein
VTEILDEVRSIIIGGRSEIFCGYDALARRADSLIAQLHRIEAALGANPLGSDRDWRDLAEAAEALVTVSTAQEVWLADHDAALACKIDRARADIRSLNIPQRIDGSGDVA